MIALAIGGGALLAVVLVVLPLPHWSLLPLMTAIGYSTGIAGPSRDLLVRRAATSRFGQAAYGRVYGFVYWPRQRSGAGTAAVWRADG